MAIDIPDHSFLVFQNIVQLIFVAFFLLNGDGFKPPPIQQQDELLFAFQLRFLLLLVSQALQLLDSFLKQLSKKLNHYNLD